MMLTSSPSSSPASARLCSHIHTLSHTHTTEVVPTHQPRDRKESGAASSPATPRQDSCPHRPQGHQAAASVLRGFSGVHVSITAASPEATMCSRLQRPLCARFSIPMSMLLAMSTRLPCPCDFLSKLARPQTRPPSNSPVLLKLSYPQPLKVVGTPLRSAMATTPPCLPGSPLPAGSLLPAWLPHAMPSFPPACLAASLPSCLLFVRKKQRGGRA